MRRTSPDWSIMSIQPGLHVVRARVDLAPAVSRDLAELRDPAIEDRDIRVNPWFPSPSSTRPLRMTMSYSGASAAEALPISASIAVIVTTMAAPVQLFMSRLHACQRR